MYLGFRGPIFQSMCRSPIQNQTTLSRTIRVKINMINEHQSKIIYICIGNAGTGKSTFVKSLGGDVPSSELVSSGDSLTTKARFYELDRDPVVLLVDTPGFRDSRSFDHKLEFSDSEHMREILNAFLRKQASHFNGVYWFANDPRTTDELRDQARFIDALVNPELQTHAVDRSLGWKHVTVLLRGNAVDGMAVRSVVQTVTGSLAVATSLHMKIVGLAVDGKDPGYCDLKIQGTSVQNSKTRDILELRPSIRSQVLENWFRAKDPIQVCSSNNEDEGVLTDVIYSG
jgi:GTP-binding protein EngB required for normal cell division